jgi:membrane peptidoglycan carboxypeptidase
MNKRQVISSLNNIAEELDNNGLYVEAKSITNVMNKLAQQMPEQNNEAALAIPPQTRDNLIAMLKNVQKINATCYSLLTFDTISQSHIDSFISIEKDVTALKNILPLYMGKNLL